MSETDDKTCGGANINQKGTNAKLKGLAPSKHPKHLNNPNSNNS